MTDEQLDGVVAKVNDLGLIPDLSQKLKAEWPDLHFTLCFDDDVCGPKPVREQEGYNIYLVNGRDHCLSFTTNLDVATGLVVAELVDEDEEF